MLKPGAAYYGEFCTSSATGAAVDADSLPAATANHNGTDDGSFALTVAKIDTGRYKVTGTVPNGYVAGDIVNISVVATIGGVTTKAAIDGLTIDTKSNADLDTDILTRLATSSYTAPSTTAQIATAVWRDTTAGDFNVSGSIGASLFTAGNVPGAANGLALVGSSMDVTTFAGQNIVQTAGKLWVLDGSGNPVASDSALNTLQTTANSILGGVTAIPTNPYTGTPPTVGEIATGVWQDATAGDFTVSGSIGKSLFTSGNIPGAAGGLSTHNEVASLQTTANNISVLVSAIPTNPYTGTPPTVVQIAAGIWQDATSGHFNVSGSIGKSLFTGGNVPGTADGLALVGSAMTLTAGERMAVATALLVLTDGIETGVDLQEAMRAILSVLAGKKLISGNTITFRDVNDTIDRITATLDLNNQRISITYNL